MLVYNHKKIVKGWCCSMLRSISVEGLENPVSSLIIGSYYAVIDPERFIENHEVDSQEANQATAVYGTPLVDGEYDEIWDNADELLINRYQTAWNGADGVGRVLWDEENLYVFIEVNDSELDKTSDNPWEHDSIEVFIDENNTKTSYYEEDDGQYLIVAPHVGVHPLTLQVKPFSLQKLC